MVVEPLDSVADLLADFEPGLSPADDGEEELEWISNREAFPPLETFVPAAAQPPPPPPSPVSVLPLAPPLRAPARARSRIRRRKRRFFSPTVQVPVAVAAPVPADMPAGGRRRCLHCEAEVTPQWRAGPGGPKTLCNACGVRYKSGRLFPEYRPANSPTFSAALHSNSHRRIIEMRRRTGPGSGSGSGPGSGRRGRPRLVSL